MVKVLIIECEKVIEQAKKNAQGMDSLRKQILPIFDQGYDVDVVAKPGFASSLDNACIILSQDELLGFTEATTKMLSGDFSPKFLPKFFGIVSELETSSKISSKDSRYNKMIDSLPFEWCTIKPSLVTDNNGLVNWGKTFDIVAERFELKIV